MQTQTKRIQKLITFPKELYSLVMNKANRIGMTFPEYVRILVVNDLKGKLDSIPMVSAKTEKNIENSFEALKQGQYTELKTIKDIKNYFKNL